MVVRGPSQIRELTGRSDGIRAKNHDGGSVLRSHAGCRETVNPDLVAHYAALSDGLCRFVTFDRLRGALVLTSSTVRRAATCSSLAALLALSPASGAPATASGTTLLTAGSETSTGSGTASVGPTGSASGPDLKEPQTSSEGVEVVTHGVVTVRAYQRPDATPVTMAVHGVQRVDGATIVYFSAGWADGERPDPAGLSELSSPAASNGGYTNGADIGSIRLTDVAGATVYRTVATPDGRSANGFGSDLDAFPDEPGVMGAMYAVLPELPATTDTVDVQLLWGATVPDVPVADGLLEPTADPSGVIPFGTGWPEVDTDLLEQIESPERYTYSLHSVVEALDRSQTVTEQGDTVTVDLAADVLFAFDSADLSPAAQAKLAEVAATVREGRATGDVTVLGHTDNQGSDSYNQSLSAQRAQSVAAVLQPALAGLPVTFTVEGRGESEPVADNGSDEGRQANRRVSITYTIQGDS